MGDEDTKIIQSDITEIKVMLAKLEERIHGVPCNDLTQYQKTVKDEFDQIGKKFRLVFDKIELHNEKYHSEKSFRDNWVGYAVVGCTIVTFLQPFIQKWLA